MADEFISVDEFLSQRKDFVKSGDILLKASRAPSSWNKDKRSIRFTMSAEIADRMGDIVYQQGMATDAFATNPTAFFNHRSGDLPIGTWSQIEKVLNGRPKRTEGTLTLVPEGINPMADAVAAHIDAGAIRACSIGFIPKKIKLRREKNDNGDERIAGFDIHESDLVECSPVTVPANPAAIAKSIQEGDKSAMEILEMVLDTWSKHPETGLIVPKSEFDMAWKEATGQRTSVVTTETKHVGQAAEAGNEADPQAPETKAADESATSPVVIKIADGIEATVKHNEDGTIDVNFDQKARLHAADFVVNTSENTGFKISGDAIITGTVGKPAAEKAVAQLEQAMDEKSRKGRGLLRRALSLFSNGLDKRFEAEVQALRLAEAQKIVDEAAVKDALHTRYQTIEARLGAKGLV